VKRQRKTISYNPTRQVVRFPHLRDLSVIYEGRSEDIHVRPPDISQHGMFINTSRRFPEGSVLKLRFALTRTGIEITTRCEVRYCLAGVGIGVEFLNLPTKFARAIQNEIRKAGLGRG